MSVNVEKVKSFGLSFEESIYAFAFDLDDEIGRKGKEVVFEELACREKMVENVHKVLAYRYAYGYVLRQFLGYVPRSAVEEERIKNRWALGVEECFNAAIRWLRDYRQRYILAGGAELWDSQKTDLSISNHESDSESQNSAYYVEAVERCMKANVSDLIRETKVLMDEVRYCNQRRDQALSRIEALLAEIQKRGERPEGLAVENVANMSGMPDGDGLDLEGSILQIRWPKRSLQVLQKLKIRTVRQAVEFFGDFEKFVTAELRITLWEWAVITTILRREGLLLREGKMEVQLDDDLSEVLDVVLEDESSTRPSSTTIHQLRRRGANTIMDLMSIFAENADSGWYTLSHYWPGFGKACEKHLAGCMRTWDFVVPLDMCYPSEKSTVLALDWYGLNVAPRFYDSTISEKLGLYQIETIGALIEACKDENRFSGLRYIDPELYKIALERLEAYEFSVQ